MNEIDIFIIIISSSIKLTDVSKILLQRLYLKIMSVDVNGDKLDELHKQLVFLTCLMIVCKFEMDKNISIDSFKYFSTKTMNCINLREKIEKLEFCILDYIQFDLDRFKDKNYHQDDYNSNKKIKSVAI